MCGDCHQPDPDGPGFCSVEYRAHCETCHGIELESRESDFDTPIIRALPHAGAAQARRAAIGAHSAWLLRQPSLDLDDVGDALEDFQK